MAGIGVFFWRIGQGILFFFRANTLHRVHSPFVTGFAKAVLPAHSTPIGAKIESFRKKLLADNRVVEIADFGAGYDGDQRAFRQVMVSEIAKGSARARHSGELLARLAVWKRPQTALELGTNLGFSTLYLATANPTTQWHTIEGSPNLADLAKQHFQHFQLAPNLYVGTFQAVLPEILPKIPPLDMVLIDGHHTSAAVLALCQNIKPYLAPEAMVIIDDIRWTPDMLAGWEQITQIPDFQLTIELFQTGICFFKRPQAKQSFRLLG